MTVTTISNTPSVELEIAKQSPNDLKIISNTGIAEPSSIELKANPNSVEQLKQKITEQVSILSSKELFKESGLSRKDHLKQLIVNFAEFYNYSEELIRLFLDLFSPAECLQFLEANERPRPLCIRSNSIKVKRRQLAQALINRGVDLDPIGNWTDCGLKITSSPVPIGATPEYLAGLYMLQSASSMVPVHALSPQQNERIADLCAAPGGKTTHIAAAMRNSGALVANDSNKARLKALAANLHRLGVTNCVVTNYDGIEFKRHFGLFDRVLVDAPCSGLGVVSRDESIKKNKSQADIGRCSHLQKNLLLSAIDMVDCRGKSPAIVVYSTCSVMVEENEEIVNYALNRRYIKMVPLGLSTDDDFGVNGFVRYRAKRFHPSLKMAKRFYPHVHNMDGFFVAKMVKYKMGVKGSDNGEDQFNPDFDEKDDLEELLGENEKNENKQIDAKNDKIEEKKGKSEENKLKNSKTTINDKDDKKDDQNETKDIKKDENSENIMKTKSKMIKKNKNKKINQNIRRKNFKNKRKFSQKSANFSKNSNKKSKITEKASKKFKTNQNLNKNKSKNSKTDQKSAKINKTFKRGEKILKKVKKSRKY